MKIRVLLIDETEGGEPVVIEDGIDDPGSARLERSYDASTTAELDPDHEYTLIVEAYYPNEDWDPHPLVRRHLGYALNVPPEVRIVRIGLAQQGQPFEATAEITDDDGNLSAVTAGDAVLSADNTNVSQEADSVTDNGDGTYTFTFNEAPEKGEYTLAVMASDSVGETDEAERNVTVEAKPYEEEAAIQNQTFRKGTTPSFAVSDYYGDGTTWKSVESSDASVSVLSGSGSTFELSMDAVGSAIITVTSENDSGATDEQTFQVEVVQEDDLFAVIDFEVRELTVDYNASMIEGDPVRFDWDFGDGYTATGPNSTHRYRRPNSSDNPYYRVALTIEEGDGDTYTATRDVTVEKTYPQEQLEQTSLMAWRAPGHPGDGYGQRPAVQYVNRHPKVTTDFAGGIEIWPNGDLPKQLVDGGFERVIGCHPNTKNGLAIKAVEDQKWELNGNNSAFPASEENDYNGTGNLQPVSDAPPANVDHLVDIYKEEGGEKRLDGQVYELTLASGDRIRATGGGPVRQEGGMNLSVWAKVRSGSQDFALGVNHRGTTFKDTVTATEQWRRLSGGASASEYTPDGATMYGGIINDTGSQIVVYLWLESAQCEGTPYATPVMFNVQGVDLGYRRNAKGITAYGPALPTDVPFDDSVSGQYTVNEATTYRRYWDFQDETFKEQAITYPDDGVMPIPYMRGYTHVVAQNGNLGVSDFGAEEKQQGSDAFRFVMAGQVGAEKPQATLLGDAGPERVGSRMLVWGNDHVYMGLAGSSKRKGEDVAESDEKSSFDASILTQVDPMGNVESIPLRLNWSDDHGAPSLGVMPDDHLLAAVTRHPSPDLYVWRSVNPVGSDNFELEKAAGDGIAASGSGEFVHCHVLPVPWRGPEGRMYLTYRGETGDDSANQGHIWSDDFAQTFNSPSGLIRTSVGGRIYPQYHVDVQRRKIHIFLVRGNRHDKNAETGEFGDWTIRHAVWQDDGSGGEEFRRADGSLLTSTKPVDVSEDGMDYAHDKAETSSDLPPRYNRVQDVKTDADGYPVAAFAEELFESNESQTEGEDKLVDNEIWVTRWDGSQWVDEHVADCGPGLEGSLGQAGASLIDSERVLINSSVGTASGREVQEIWLYERVAKGDWQGTQLTFDSPRDLYRPRNVQNSVPSDEVRYTYTRNEMDRYTDMAVETFFSANLDE